MSRKNNTGFRNPRPAAPRTPTDLPARATGIRLACRVTHTVPRRLPASRGCSVLRKAAPPWVVCARRAHERTVGSGPGGSRGAGGRTGGCRGGSAGWQRADPPCGAAQPGRGVAVYPARAQGQERGCKAEVQS